MLSGFALLQNGIMEDDRMLRMEHGYQIEISCVQPDERLQQFLIE